MNRKPTLLIALPSLALETGYTIRVRLMMRLLRAVSPMVAAEEAQHPDRLLAFESPRRWLSRRWRKELNASAAESGFRPLLVPWLPQRFPGHFWLNTLWGSLWVAIFSRWFKASVLHAESHHAAAVSLLASRGKRRLTFDVHGAEIEELVVGGRLRPGSLEQRFRAFLQTACVRRADTLITVSAEMIRHLESETGVSIDGDKTRVIPCVSSLPLPSLPLSQLRAEAKRRLRFDGQLVVGYVGGADDWQQPEFLAEVFKEVHRLDPSVGFLVVSSWKVRFQSLLSEAGIPDENLRVVSVPHARVAEVAAAMDAGLLLRRDDVVNRVASPTKFAEYLSLGIAPVVTEALPDFAKLVEEFATGLVVGADADATDVARQILSHLNRRVLDDAGFPERCRQVAEHHLSLRFAESQMSPRAESKAAAAPRSKKLHPGTGAVAS